MFSRIFQKFKLQPQGSVTSADFNPRVAVHYGVPATASIIALDPVQSLLAVGTLDGRIKVIGGDNIEALLTSPKKSPFKNLQFLQNQGFLASVSSDNKIQVWDLESRQIASTLQWESNITAFSVIYGTSYMYIGCEHGIVSILKFDTEDKNINLRPYYIPTNVIADTAGVSLPDHLPVVGVLHQPCSPGNRMLIAYENGLLVLWDASEDQVVLIRGYKDLQLKDAAVVDSVKVTKNEPQDDWSGHKLMEKDISSLCWVSDNGTVLAVGYVDGDIMFWDLSNTASKDQLAASLPNKVVKLELSSGSKRLPVIVLHWSASRSTSNQCGQLFVYGGDQIGSEEVVTILSINWSSGIESLKCMSRVDLTLNGSFADMVLLPSSGTMEKNGDLLFILTSPGQLHTYDHDCLSALMSQQKKKLFVSAVQYLPVIPTIEPNMIAAKLGLVHKDGEFSRALSKMVSSKKLNVAHSPKGGKSWPLSGGVPGQPFDAKNYQVERVYIAGYQDGSVQMWDATYPVLMPIYTIEPPMVNYITLSSMCTSVLALDFCSITLRLAIGSQSGLVRLYNLTDRTDEKRLHFITETQNEVLSLQQEDGPHCIAVFSIANSPVCMLQFAHSGARLAVGFESGKVTLVDLKTLSMLFVIGGISESSSPVNSLVVKSFSEGTSLMSGPEDTQSNVLNDPEREVVIMMTRNAHIVLRYGTTDNLVSAQSFLSKMDSTAISMHVIEVSDFISEVHNEKHPLNSPHKNEAKDEPRKPNPPSGSTQNEPEIEKSNKNAYFGQSLKSLFVLLCCEDALYLYSLHSVIEGDSSSIHKVNFTKPCCWTTMFKKDEEDCGIIILYSTGDIEIRSLPSFKVVGESSLMSILRWNFKTNMDKTICSSNDGQIILVNGGELAFVSLLAYENNFRIPESLPSLYDQVLSAAVDSTYNLSPSQKQAATPGIFGSIIKDLKAVKGEQNIEVFKLDGTHLERLFSYPPFLKHSTTVKDIQQHVELKIDNIILNEPLIVSSSSDSKRNDTKANKGTEKEKLFDSATDSKPKMRTAEEIKAKYRKTGDASAAAAMAKDKLIERQEKLAKLRENTEELQHGAEDFAAMTKEIAKRMENRKWWQI